MHTCFYWRDGRQKPFNLDMKPFYYFKFMGNLLGSMAVLKAHFNYICVIQFTFWLLTQNFFESI